MDFSAQLQAALDDMFGGWRQRFQAFARKAERFLEKARNPAEASYKLGRELAVKGLFEEAKYRFKFTLWKQPHRASAWYNLACCHLALGEDGEGIAALKKSLSFNPKDESALFMLATMGGGQAGNFEPHTTPPELVRSEFTMRAATYDEEELGERGYRGHQHIYETFLELLGDNPRLSAILDGGCGTGLCAPLLRSHCKTLIGLDVTPAMMNQALNRLDSGGAPYYDMHLEEDLRTYLLHQEIPLYDAIILANVCNVIGGLAPVLDGAKKALKPGGWIIFSTDKLTGLDGYRLDLAKRRFAHSAEYLKAQTERSGLQPRLLKEMPLYGTEPAWMVALQKAA